MKIGRWWWMGMAAWILLAACGDSTPEADEPRWVVPDAGGSNNSNNLNNPNSSNNSGSNNLNNDNNPGNNPELDAGGDAAEPVDAALDASEPEDASGEDVSSGDVGPDAPLMGAVVERRCGAVVELAGAPGASTVTVSGSFNGWDVGATPLAREGGVWRAQVDVPAGSYAYKFVIDGQYEASVPADVLTQWDGGVENRRLVVSDCQQPEWRSLGTAMSPEGVLTGSYQFARASGGAGLDASSVRLTVGGAPVPVEVDAEREVVSFRWEAPGYGKHSVRLWGSDAAGLAAENNPFYVPIWHEAEPFTWQDATIYLIFTDRFRDSDGLDRRISGAEERANYLGGDFRGIIQAIEEGYFADLGVNTLWLSPIYDNTDQIYPDKNNDRSKMMTGFHGYWPTSLAPEPRYGDAERSAAERLKELSDVAHGHGIRVMFDLALNHVHEDHAYCQEHPDWCSLTCICGSDNCGWDPAFGRGLDCQFDSFLPDLSYKNPAILERVVEDTLEMLEAFDVDGLRIDAARHMDHVIMRTLRLTLRDTTESYGGAPYYMVGETFTDNHGEIMAYVADHELHGQFDFFTRTQIRSTFGFGGSFRALDDAMAFNESEAGYGRFVWWMSPFFGNHDIDRFATVIAGNDQGPWGPTVDLMAAGPADTVDQWNIINRMTLASVFLLTMKGIPLMYYGDEIGLAGSRDPDNRRTMFWDLNANQRELLGRVQSAGQARRQLRALRHGERRELWKDDDLYVYLRSEVPGDGVIVAMNKGGVARTETIQVPAVYGLEGATLESFNSDRAVTVSSGAISVTLNPWEFAIFHAE